MDYTVLVYTCNVNVTVGGDSDTVREEITRAFETVVIKLAHQLIFSRDKCKRIK